MYRDSLWGLLIYIVLVALWIIYRTRQARPLRGFLVATLQVTGLTLTLLYGTMAVFWVFPAKWKEAIAYFLSDHDSNHATLKVDDRSALVFHPKAMSVGQTYPLLLFLHGFSSNPIEAIWYLSLKDEVERFQFILLAPSGLNNKKNRRFWNASEHCCDFDQTGVDDNAYLLELVEAAQREYPIDAEKIFVLGHSNGGFMAYSLACGTPQVFRGIVSLAGAASGQESQCSRDAAVDILHIHGTKDHIISYDGSGRETLSAVESVSAWAIHNNCEEKPKLESQALDLSLLSFGAETDIMSWSQCRDGSRVTLWTVNNVGHAPYVSEVFFGNIWEYLLQGRS